VPLRSSRPLKALIATGIAVATVTLAALPAGASQVRSAEWWLNALGIRQSWTATRGAGVVVAVLSDGVDAKQRDLTGVVTTGPDFTGTRQESGQFFGQTGTGIASLIAGHGYGPSSQSGVVGVAPSARILSIRVTLPADDPAMSTAAPGLTGAIASGIRYAVAHGASVIDLPIDPGQPGSGGTGGASAAAGGSAAEQSAISYALAHNVVLVAPAGDDGAGTDAVNYPAGYSGVIAVGAVNSSYVKPPWTSGQRYVTLTAPGWGVMAATNTGFQEMSSTSAASAVAAGVAALIRGRFPGLSAAEVRQAMITGTILRRADGLDHGSGYGVINAPLALTAANAQAPAGSRAGNLAQPDAAPATPAAQSSTLTGQLATSGAVSAGLLVLLLLCIAAYRATARRRAGRQQVAVAAGWTGRQAQPRYPRAGVADADRMLEFFSSPAAAPPDRRTAGGRPATGTADSGRGLFASGRSTPGRRVPGHAAAEPASGGGAASGFAAATGGTAAAGFPATALGGTRGDPFGSLAGQPPSSPWEGADAADRAPVSPASRAVSRRPAVSGAPPWEPASQPPGEVPWAAAPGPEPAPDLAPPTQGSAPASRPAPLIPSVTSGSSPLPSRSAAAPSAARDMSSFDAFGYGTSGGGVPETDTFGYAQPGYAQPGYGPSAGGPSEAGTFGYAQPGYGPSGAETDAFAQPGYGPPGAETDAFAQPGYGTSGADTDTFGYARPGYGPSGDGPSGTETPAFGLPRRQPAADPAGFDAAGTDSSWPASTVPGAQGPTGRLDRSYEPLGRHTQPAAAAEAAPDYLPSPLQRPGSPLPVRQPGRHAPTSTPLSPSGSLWERAVEPAEQPAGDMEHDSRPIYVWNPGGDGYSGERDSGLTDEQPRWTLQVRSDDGSDS
jgi:Subtilase family